MQAISLLLSAQMLLQVATNSPHLPLSFKEMAINIAKQAIIVAQNEIQSGSYGSTNTLQTNPQPTITPIVYNEPMVKKTPYTIEYKINHLPISDVAYINKTNNTDYKDIYIIYAWVLNEAGESLLEEKITFNTPNNVFKPDNSGSTLTTINYDTIDGVKRYYAGFYYSPKDTFDLSVTSKDITKIIK